MSGRSGSLLVWFDLEMIKVFRRARRIRTLTWPVTGCTGRKGSGVSGGGVSLPTRKHTTSRERTRLGWCWKTRPDVRRVRWSGTGIRGR